MNKTDIRDSQTGGIGDNWHVEGGIHQTTYRLARPQPVDEPTLTAACERLDALPLARVPDPAPLPQGSRMSLRANPLFVGRKGDLKRLAEALKGGQTAAIGQIALGQVALGNTAAATGLGGIGKTQLASEFAHRYGQFFAGGVFWLSFADPQAIRAEVATCGGPGALDLRPNFGQLPLDDQVKLVLGAWQSPLPRLLIFDNCEDEALLAQWRPPTGGARVLVTSRRGQWNVELGVRALHLDVLPRAESVTLLRKHRPDLKDAPADALAEELGDLPLALHVAGSFLAAYCHASFGVPEAYLDALRAEGLAHVSLTDEEKTLTTAHIKHVGRTFALSYQRLDPQDATDAVALALLARSAYFAPGEVIPRGLLLATLDLPDDDVESERRAEDALARLVALGLLESDAEGDMTLHRLLAAFARQAAEDDAAHGARDAVEETLLAEADRLNNAGFPVPLLAWQPHLRAVTDAAYDREDERAAGLCNTLGYHLKMISDYTEARPYYERALAIRETILGPNHPDTARSLNNLGLLLKTMDDYDGARRCYEEALAIRETVLCPDHPETATSLNNLGVLLKTMGDYDGARRYYERALAIRESVLGPDHPDTARSLNNLGLLLKTMDDYDGARRFYEEALAIRETVLCPDHPETATSLNNLGVLLKTMGDYDGARRYYERALAIRESVLGPDHPETATSLNNLGVLLKKMGNLAEAADLLRCTLKIRKVKLGLKHPKTLSSQRNLDNIEARLREDDG
jgi:tetratricopeptide (TPR) repeat protein